MPDYEKLIEDLEQRARHEEVRATSWRHGNAAVMDSAAEAISTLLKERDAGSYECPTCGLMVKDTSNAD
jgi:rubrerythrin